MRAMDFIRNPKKAFTDARYAVIGKTDPFKKLPVSSVLAALPSAKKTVEGVLYGAQDYAPYVRKLLAEYGNQKILSLTAYRKPVDKPLTMALNVVSLGQFAKQNPYDELFHLSLVAQMEDGFISIEKIENINLVLNPTTHPKAESQVIGNFHSVTLNELMEGGKRILGDKFFKYDASNNNCQDFIMALLKGSDLGTPENYKFIKQDTEQIFKGLEKTRALSVAITDLGNRASVARYGGELSNPLYKAEPKLMNLLRFAQPKVRKFSASKRQENPWFAHVRKYAKEHGISYTQAMKPASKTYRLK